MMSRALEAIRRGDMVVVTDDADRENEGDLVMAADAVTPEAIAFMAVHGRGLICLSMEPERLDALRIGPMLPGADAETNFTVSIDFAEPGSTGISAADRARTIRHAVADTARPGDFRRPGHVFPLRYTPGGVLARRGHTEASVDLTRLAGRAPAGVICEILNDDGTMARGADLEAFAAKHGLETTSVAEMAEYLGERPLAALASHPARTHVSAAAHVLQQVCGEQNACAAAGTGPVTRVARTVLPSRYGTWRTDGFRGSDGLEYVVLTLGDPTDPARPALVRLHSECLTGDALGSMRCDCGDQLDMAMRLIAEEGTGAIVYIRGHEGRGIGLLPKLQAYELQDQGWDTVDANLALGYRSDARSYPGAAAVLRELGIVRVRLLTNNVEKVAGLRDHGIEVALRIPLISTPSPTNLHYLTTKHNRMGHQLHGLSAG
jgi:3,4-dihydroxy 2-butanone 4-phosphate synthase/GTP cyclohydrolase II